jgi:hypothetical protein
MSVAGIVTVSCLLLTNDIVWDAPFHVTTELLLKLLPLMVSTKPAPPAVALLGEIEVSDGVDGQEQEMTGSKKIANAHKRDDLFIVVVITMGHLSAISRAAAPRFEKIKKNTAVRCGILYGDTVIVAARLVIFPIEAVTCTVPPVVMPDTIVTSPADTVAKLVLLEVQVATSVTSVVPLHVVAIASMGRVGKLVVTLPLVGLRTIDCIQPTVTVNVCVPVIEGFWLAAAVTVADPTLTDVTKPVEEIVAIVVGVILQETEGLLSVLPSLLVPKTVICTVFDVFPVSMTGEAGPTASEDIVGFTKNPVHATPRPASSSTAKDAARRSLCLVVNIVVDTPSSAPTHSNQLQSLPRVQSQHNCRCKKL